MRTFRVAAIVVLVLNLVLVLAFIVPALFLVMASDGCRGACPVAVVETGFSIALIGPGIVFVTGLAFTIVAFARKLNPLWPAVIGIGGSVGAFLLGVGITFVAVG